MHILKRGIEIKHIETHEKLLNTDHLSKINPSY